MARKKKTYKVINSLPEGLGSLVVLGSVLEPGAMLPSNAPEAVIKDYLDRELIEEAVGAKPAASKPKKEAPKKEVPKPEINPEWVKSLKPISKWALNPVDLIGKNLTELNIMILEKDSEMDPFDDMDAAIEYLSRDFEG